MQDVDGVNGGVNGGRTCWTVAGTFCGGVVRGTFAAKYGTCNACEFLKAILAETETDIIA
jgi:hypothetical protein